MCFQLHMMFYCCCCSYEDKSSRCNKSARRCLNCTGIWDPPRHRIAQESHHLCSSSRSRRWRRNRSASYLLSWSLWLRKHNDHKTATSLQLSQFYSPHIKKRCNLALSSCKGYLFFLGKPRLPPICMPGIYYSNKIVPGFKSVLWLSLLHLCFVWK